MLSMIKRNSYKICKKYNFKRDCAMRNSTHQPKQNTRRLGNSCSGRLLYEEVTGYWADPADRTKYCILITEGTSLIKKHNAAGRRALVVGYNDVRVLKLIQP